MTKCTLCKKSGYYKQLDYFALARCSLRNSRKKSTTRARKIYVVTLFSKMDDNSLMEGVKGSRKPYLL